MVRMMDAMERSKTSKASGGVCEWLGFDRHLFVQSVALDLIQEISAVDFLINRWKSIRVEFNG